MAGFLVGRLEDGTEPILDNPLPLTPSRKGRGDKKWDCLRERTKAGRTMAGNRIADPSIRPALILPGGQPGADAALQHPAEEADQLGPHPGMEHFRVAAAESQGAGRRLG